MHIYELGDSGWHPGWYTAEVQGYNTDDDIVLLHYPSEPGCIYDVELSPLIATSKIQLLKPVL